MATSADRAHGRDEMARQIVKRLEEKKVMFPKSFTTEEKRVNVVLRALVNEILVQLSHTDLL